jgi:hypothetical protein
MRMRNHISKRFFSITIVVVFIISCQNENHKNVEFLFEEIDSNVSKIIDDDDNGQNKEINLADLIPFSWDELYIFKPYTPLSEIEESLGFVWKEANKTHINLEDRFNLLVFIEKREVIHYIMWPRSKGDFSKIEKSKYLYDSAKFILKKERIGNQDWNFFYVK